LSTRKQVSRTEPTADFAPCEDGSCPVSKAVRVLDGRWTILVVRDLLGGTRRFTDLRRSLGDVSPKTLTDRLRQLEDAGLVHREIYAEVPPRVEYSLTDEGRALEPVLASLAAWGRSLP
jgi:DNA-binding HxlR family transcriptional regulator